MTDEFVRPYGGAWEGPLFVLTHRPEDAARPDAEDPVAVVNVRYRPVGTTDLGGLPFGDRTEQTERSCFRCESSPETRGREDS
jgi:hypothetical protein